MKIRYFSNFCDSTQCKEKVELICESVVGEKFTITDKDDYTHAIILNTATPQLSIPRENVIGFAFEPPQFLGITPDFIEYAQKNISRYVIGEKGTLPSPFVEGFAYMWHIVPPKSIPLKNKLCSIMISEKQHTWGHRYRYELVTRILATNLPIDIYGRGCRFFRNDTRLCGEFREMDPIMYSQYLFHIAIENSSLPHYISEKVINPLLCGTTPLYWGCPNIDTYFPNTTHRLSGNIIEDMKIIHAILREPFRYKKNINIQSIQDTTNIAETFGAETYGFRTFPFVR
jgi:hypothetical protein